MSCQVHLLVMIHGMWGTPKHLSEVQRVISEKHETALWNADNVDTEGGTRLDILVAQTNQTISTYDGIDWGGERVAEEVYERIAEIEKGGKCKVTLFSVFGYSFGGLLGRYLIGILDSRKFFETVKPANFTTFATPHIGVPRYKSLLSTFTATLGSKLLSRTGEQFYGVDKWGKEGRPLLEVMANKDRIFWRALSLFPHIHIYANAISDTTVPFVTAAIELEDPFPGIDKNEIEIKLDPNYGALVESYKHIPRPPPSRFSLPSLTPSRPFLPLFLRRGLVFETTLIILSPVIYPAMFSLAVLRLTLDSRASRSRIQRLEADASSASKLVNILDSLENAVEHFIDPTAEQEQDPSSPQPPPASPRAIEHLIDPIAEQDSLEQDPSSPQPPPASPRAIAHLVDPIAGQEPQPRSTSPPDAPLPRSKGSLSLERATEHKNHSRTSDSQLVLTHAQTQMVQSLNALPQMEKHYAFFHPVRNAHGLIVCREVDQARRIGGEWAAWMPKGEGVLRHWADGFVLVV